MEGRVYLALRFPRFRVHDDGVEEAQRQAESSHRALQAQIREKKLNIDQT